jgi:hypothetical protein
LAVYQIARIQIRRGQSQSGTGIPQLASGEMAWAVDTQQLFIGNGSVSEGAPAVGNTRFLSTNDVSIYGNLLSISQYSYKSTDSTVQTGLTSASPVYRSLQSRFDDFATSADFGMIGDNSTDNAPMLQQAINTLFLNASHQASAQSAAGANSRITLQIAPGIYNISKTIYIPSYANINGTGPEKTIFNFVPTSGNTTPLFQFVNDTSSPGTYNVTSGLQYTNQARFVQLYNFSISLPNGTNIGMQLDSVRSGIFENININSNTTNFTVYSATNIGIVMNAFSSVVTCEENTFRNISINSTTIAVYAQQDIINNFFENIYIYDAQQGISWGAGSNGSSTGQQFGPRQTTVSSIRFNKVKQQAIYLERGEFNNVLNLRMTDVGNNDAGASNPVYPQVFFKTVGNTVSNIVSDRADSLATTNTMPYVPEVSGNIFFPYSPVFSLSVGQVSSATLLFRLPASTDQYGVPNGTISYDINYIYRSTINSFARTGNIYLAADVAHAKIQLADDYNFAGTDSGNTTAQILTFSANFLDATGAIYVGSGGQVATTIAIYYTNTLSGDAGTLNYSYSINSRTI